MAKSGKLLKAGLAGLAFVAWPGNAFACTTCAIAATWYIFPPLLFWAWIFPFWFLVLSLLSTLARRKMPGIPPLWRSFYWAGALGLTGLIWIGPFAALPLAIMVVVGWLAFIGQRRSENEPIWFRRSVHAASLMAVVGLVATSVPEFLNPTPRDPLDVIREWPATQMSRVAMDKLAAGENSRESLRRIIRGMPEEYTDFEALEAFEKLKVVEEPEIDVPLLIDAYARAFKPSDEPYVRTDAIEADLEEVTGISLARRSSPEAWRKAWAAAQLDGPIDEATTASLGVL